MAQSDEVQAKHESAFEYLEARIDWSLPSYKQLVGFDGLGEVRLQGKLAWRIFGFRRDFCGAREFVVTHIGNHKGNVYSPRKVLKQAAMRMKEIQNDPSKSKSCSRPQ